MISDSAPQHTDIIMRLRGNGAADLLHGQTTADFSACKEGDTRYAAFCNPKGRVLADVRVAVISGDEMLMRGRKEVMLQLSEHLKPFLALARTELTPTDWHVSATPAANLADVAALDGLGESLNRVALPAEGEWQEIWSPASEDRAGREGDLAWYGISVARARVELGESLVWPNEFGLLCRTRSHTRMCMFSHTSYSVVPPKFTLLPSAVWGGCTVRLTTVGIGAVGGGSASSANVT